VQAVRTTMQRVGFAALLAARPSRERGLVVAMVAARILEPDSKLATTRWWHTTTLPASLGVADADEDDLYAAMDWLLARQERIEQKLAARHLTAGGLVLYDLTSSYFEGTTCPLAALGHNRDGKKGKLQVNYGLLTGGRGCPVAVSVFKGNTGDPKTLLPQVTRLRDRFGIEHLVLVGDRGMISQTQINAVKALAGVDWITALKTGALRGLVADGALQLGLFDERNLFELTHPDFLGERLMACRNPELAKLRAHKRHALLAATVKELEKVRAMVARGRLKGRDAIGVRVGKVVNKYKVAKHIRLAIDNARLDFHIDAEQVAAEAALDGLYVVRTSVRRSASAPTTPSGVTSASATWSAFRSLKTLDLKCGRSITGASARASAHLPLHAGLLRRVAPARGLAPAAVCRRGPAGESPSRSGGAREALRGGPAQSAREGARRRHGGPQFPDPAQGPEHHRPQRVSPPGRRPCRADLPDRHYPDAHTATRLRPAEDDHRVDRKLQRVLELSH
jgi:hypothetical protein